MAAPTSSHELLALVHKSGLATDEQLAPYLALADTATAESLAERLVGNKVLTRFQARKLLADKWRGVFLGGYSVLGALRKGGMGDVFLACQQHPQRLVAL